MTRRDEPTRLDRIAREAARLMELGEIAAIHDAIDVAADKLDLANGPMPGPGRVRKHAQAMAMQALGDAGYEANRRRIWMIAEELMTALEAIVPDVETLLVGRGARGEFDADPALHIRVYTDRSLRELAEALVEVGYEDPSFDTVRTTYGRLNRILFMEEDIEITLTRCLPRLGIGRDTNMFTGRALETIDLSALRCMLNAP